MGSTALQARGERLGAQVGEYRGATTAAYFSSPQAEYSALHAGCGVWDLGFRAKISITGKDRVRWLNGMVTNNIRDLAAGQGVYAFLLNPQGHILGDLYAYNRGESIMVDTDRAQEEKILATFEHYIIMDDVEVVNLREMTALGIGGPGARAVLRRSGIEISETRPLQIFDVKCTCQCDCVECTAVRDDNQTVETYELWLAAQDARKTWDALVASGATPVGSEALELQRIGSGIPLYDVDIHERDLPQETDQSRALNFSKGCYIGQEIVERIRSRGAVHRKFSGFLAQGAAKIPVGTKICVGGKDMGEVTSAASLPLANGERTIALGYIRREIAVPGREVTLAETPATVVELPIHNLDSAREKHSLEQRRA
jgi:folate-binding protein YgfZ